MNTILLVEDNPHIMKINHAALMMEGYRILEAATAAAVLAATSVMPCSTALSMASTAL